MATGVEIVFIGLCSFLNIDGTHLEMPPPSVILHNDSAHTPYIAYDTTKVVLSSTPTVTPTSLGGNYAIIKLTGEELILNDNAGAKPNAKTDFDKVVHFATYSGDASPSWHRARVPLNGDLPDDSEVAAYIELGGGDLYGERVSPIRWQFKDPGNGTLSGQQADKFARAVRYKFMSATDNLIIRARALDGTSHRRLVFTATTLGQPVEVYIGNSVKNKELKDIVWIEPPNHAPGTHFMVFYKTVDDPLAHMFIPFPIESPGPDKGPDTGYCGPDNQP